MGTRNHLTATPGASEAAKAWEAPALCVQFLFQQFRFLDDFLFGLGFLKKTEQAIMRWGWISKEKYV